MIKIHVKNWKEYLIILLIIILVNFLLFLPVLTTEFISDEIGFLLLAKWGSNFWTFNLRYYRPLPLAIMQGIYLLYGLNPIPFHTVSMTVNIANGFLIYIFGKQIFKKQISAFLLLASWLSMSAIYFEVIAWIATYFDLFLFFFTLLGLVFFLKHLRTEKLISVWFFPAVASLTLAILCKESAVFFIPALPVFELFAHKGWKETFKGMIKYLCFLPAAGIFILSKLTSSESQLKYFFWFNYLALGVYIALFPLLCYTMYKTKDPSKKFLESSCYFAFIIIAFGPTQRFWYVSIFPLFAIAIYVAFDNYDYSFYSYFSHLRNIKWGRKQIAILGLIFTIVIGNYAIYYIQASWYYYYATSAHNIALDIVATSPDPTAKEIYVVNVPATPYFWVLHQSHVDNLIYLRYGEKYYLKFVYIDDANKYLFEGFWFYLPSKVSIAEFDALSNDTQNNTVYLFYFSLMSVRNVSSKTYAELFT